MYDKRDKFPFFIVRMPQFCSNIPSSIFYGSFFSELLRIARCTLLFIDFIGKASELYHRMVSQGGNPKQLANQIKKSYNRYHDIFAKYDKALNEISASIQAPLG